MISLLKLGDKCTEQGPTASFRCATGRGDRPLSDGKAKQRIRQQPGRIFKKHKGSEIFLTDDDFGGLSDERIALAGPPFIMIFDILGVGKKGGKEGREREREREKGGESI